MDTDREYLMMCEKSFKYIGFIQQPYIGLTEQIRNLYGFKNESGQYALLSQIDPPSPKRWFQVYFQDQLQEMLKGNNNAKLKWFIAFHFEIDEDWSWVRKKYSQKFTSIEQMWIAFVMHNEFGKTWKGEEWKINQ